MSEELSKGPEAAARPPSLPFSYQIAVNPSEANYTEERIVGGGRVKIGKLNGLPRTDEQIVEAVRLRKEKESWYTSEYWRNKGLPAEQIEFTIGNQHVSLYSWNKEQPFTEEHRLEMERALQELGSHFPQVLDSINYILVDDVQEPSVFGDDERYPMNGVAIAPWRAFRILPRGMDLAKRHRISAASNFEGTVVHEMTHLIQDEFDAEWNDKFKWEHVFAGKHEGKWEDRQTPAGQTRTYNIETGEMAPVLRYPDKPEQCVSDYAKVAWNEDVSESVVAYVYDPERLKRVSAEKFDILSQHDAKKPKPDITSHRVPSTDIKLPEVKPETVYYYIKEQTK